MDIDPNALIILVIMVVGGLKWLAETLKTKKEQQEEDEPETFVDLYEEARQEIQDRQAQQIDPAAQYEQYADPNIFKPLTVPPVLRGGPVTTPPPLPSAAKPARAKRAALSTAEQAALERVKQHGMATRSRRGRSRSSRSRVRKLLASPTAARDAIVLREILGAPRGQM